MNDVIPFGLITDDPAFAAVISTYFNQSGKYFSVFSLPRMERNDWEFEVRKRVVSINRLELKGLFCKHQDVGLLAPLRSQVNCPLYPLETSDEVRRFAQYNFPTDYIDFPPSQYRYGLLHASKGKKLLRLNPTSNYHPSSSYQPPTSKTIIVIEKTNEVTDIAAINYALAYNYDVEFIEILNQDEVRDTIKMFFLDFADDKEMKDEHYQALSQTLTRTIDYKWLESNYSYILFFTSYVPYGILIESAYTSHLLHLQSDLRLSDEFFYQKNFNNNKIFAPSFLFVDIEATNLSSEVPTISNYLTKYKHWSFHVNGKYATRLNFRMHLEFFPYDLLLVTGHGDSPQCREVEYEFESTDGRKHKISMLEYFQFGPAVGDQIEVEVKQYPLSIDGIDWRNKETLRQKGISHVFFDFTHSKDHKVISEREAQPKTIEGLLLSDGVFIGMPGIYVQGNNPIVLINTCGSLLELGEHFSFMGCRSFIGTMWSVYDRDAKSFAIDFFSELTTDSVLKAFHHARSRITNRYSKLAYAYYGTLHNYLPLKDSETMNKASYETMAKRLLAGLQHAINYYERGWLKPHELEVVLRFLESTKKFISDHFPENESMRNQLDTFRSTLRLPHVN